MKSGDRWQCGEKPTFLDLREKHGVNIVQLADTSGVEPSTIYCMLLNRPVERIQAIQVLECLSYLVGTEYDLDSVDIVLTDVTEDCNPGTLRTM